MARATHRLDLLVLPQDPDAPAEALLGVVAAWTASGFLGEAAVGLPPPTEETRRVALHPGARPLVVGGVGQVVWMREDLPRFLANRGGGFRVGCPVTGGSVAHRLHAAMERWRGGGARVLACACGESHDLAVLDYVPAAGFARGWLELVDVEGADLVAEARALAPDVRLVLRRG